MNNDPPIDSPFGQFIRDEIARNYFDDLSGKNGPNALFDTFRELVATEMDARFNEMRFSSGDGAQIFGRDGQFTVNLPSQKRRGGVVEDDFDDLDTDPWSLRRTATAGNVAVNVGTIMKNSDQITQGLTCTNPTAEFTPAATKYLAIKIDDVNPTDYEIVLLSSWPESSGYTVSFTGTVAANTFAMTARYYPLWYFRSAASAATSFMVTTSVFGERLAPKSHLGIRLSLYRTPAGEYITLPDFEPPHKVFTA